MRRAVTLLSGGYFVRSALIASLLRIACCAAGAAQTNALETDLNTLAPLESFQECEHCPEMIVIPLGSFMMGAKLGESVNPFDIYGKDASLRRRGPDEIDVIPHEHPRHPVEMDIPYAIARNEVTHAEWMACVDAGGCTHTPDHRVFTLAGYRKLGPNHPAINVSYLDILEYTAWLNSMVGAEVYRLPTEAEWEYAARAGTETPFAQGEELTAEQANFSRADTEHLLGDNASLRHLKNRRMPVPVEELDAANPWGVRHMSGNVREWTLSCWRAEHIGLPTDSAYLAHAKSAPPCRRAAKGGAYSAAMDSVRLASRYRPTEDFRRLSLGFRVVREMKQL